MSEPTDESQDWPLRDYSQRLRPPGRTDEPVFDEPELPPATASEAEILYDEDEAEEAPETPETPEAAVEVEEEAPPAEVPPVEALVEAPAEEHVTGDFRVPDGY